MEARYVIDKIIVCAGLTDAEADSSLFCKNKKKTWQSDRFYREERKKKRERLQCPADTKEGRAEVAQEDAISGLRKKYLPSSKKKE